MKTRLLSSVVLAGLTSCVVPLSAPAARVNPDIQPPQKRQLTVANAERLAKRKAPEALPADLVSPFNPADFDKPDLAELQALQRAAAQNAPAVASPNTPPPVATDRETLDTLAAQITPSGMMTPPKGGPRLIIGRKQFEVGTRFTVSFNNQDYELELVAIDRTTFTLRYRGEEITRPIKLVR